MKTTTLALLFLSIGLIFLISLNTLALAQDKPDFAALKGRWVRTDGGYVIEIQSVNAGGQGTPQWIASALQPRVAP